MNVITNSYMHSGSLTHINYKFDPRTFIEYGIPDNFYVFNKKDEIKLKEVLNKEKLNVNIKIMKRPDITQKNKEASDNIITKEFKNIVYISPAYSGHMRYFGCADDLMSVSFEYHLFNNLYQINDNLHLNIKTHPKGLKRNDQLFQKFFSKIKILDSGLVSDLINSDDVDLFIMRMIDSTSFNEIVASNKPLILINDGNTEILTEEAKDLLKNRISIVECHYENGLARIDKNELKLALEKEYIMDDLFKQRFQYN
jgi:hypothetical protein